jgi:hypothetical protein
MYQRDPVVGPARCAGSPKLRYCLLLLALSAGCEKNHSCRPGTLLLDLAIGSAGAGADGLRVDVQTASGALHDRVGYGGQSTFGLEVEFPGGYPAGQSVVVTVTAQQGTNDLASGTVSARLDGGCARLPVTFGSIADLAIPPPCAHVTGDFSQPLDTASWVLLKDAHEDTAKARVTLNDANTSDAGALFYLPPVTMGGLDATFDLYMGSGSDGVALLLTPQRPLMLPNSALGAGVGYQGIPGWAIEFDTYHNADRGDPDNNHIGFMRADDGEHVLVMPSPVDLACNCTHKVHARLTTTHVRVEVDGLLGLDGDLPGDLDDGGVPMLAGTWTLGFTAAAGGAAAAHGIGGLTLSVGQPGSCF